LDAQTKLKRSEQVTHQIVAEEAILINLNTGTYFSLNKIGTEFWEMLDGQQSVQQHAETIAKKYEVEVSMVVGDLLELANKMAVDHLVEALT
jgi:coenzyme PQQ synthesis protein D (PqqD)